MTRKLNFPNLLNARDLGGCATRDGQQTRWQSFVRADELTRLTPQGVQSLLDYGVRTVIDLRWPAETQARPSVFQQAHSLVNYVHVSMLDESEQTWSARRPPTTKEKWNCVVLDHAQAALRETLRAIAAASDGAILFHCQAGKDRTGILAALLLALAEVTPAVIAHDYTLSTENLREPYLATYPDQREAVLENVRCPPENAYNMLAHLAERYDGAVNYLRTLGLSDQEIERIRERLR